MTNTSGQTITRAGGGAAGAGLRAIYLIAWTIAITCTALALVLLTLSLHADTGNRWGFRGFGIPFAVAYATMGLLIGRRDPRNPIAWLFTWVGLFAGLSTLLDEYVTYSTFVGRVGPSVRIASWFFQWIWVPTAVPVWTFLPWLFPTGRPPLPRWRFVGWLAAAGLLGFLVVFMITQNPPAERPAVFALFLVSFGVIIVASAAAVASLIARFRRSSGDERQQIKWFAFAACFVALSVPFNVSSNPWLHTPNILSTLALVAATGVAVLRYRLYDIDLLINRSLVYGALTLLLAVVLGASLWTVSVVLENLGGREQSASALVVSALLFGAVFQPARRGLQRFVDRRFYGIQIDYQGAASPSSGPITDRGTFGPYSELTLVGRGGMGSVYRAWHPTMNRHVALKLMQPSREEHHQFKARFDRESKTLVGLRHPSVVQVFEYGEISDTAFIVMEYLSGKDLASVLRERQRLPLEEARRIIRDVAAALDYAHARGLVHRDIKPSNIMIESDRAVLMDFGIAKVFDATAMTRTGSILGTFEYMPPEQIQGSETIDGRADVYALGAMTYQMLVGKPPFGQGNAGALLMAHLTHPPPDPSIAVPGLPGQAVKAIRKALAKDPADRFASAGIYASAL